MQCPQCNINLESELLAVKEEVEGLKEFHGHNIMQCFKSPECKPDIAHNGAIDDAVKIINSRLENK